MDSGLFSVLLDSIIQAKEVFSCKNGMDLMAGSSLMKAICVLTWKTRHRIQVCPEIRSAFSRAGAFRCLRGRELLCGGYTGAEERRAVGAADAAAGIHNTADEASYVSTTLVSCVMIHI